MNIEFKSVKKALERGEFVPYFQPVVEMSTGQLAGFEVLARWDHPELGLVLPNEFITEAESAGWIGSLTESLFQQAMTAAVSMPGSFSLAFNISPTMFRDCHLPEKINSAARLAGFSLNRLCIEVTESALITHLEQALEIATEIKALGCKLMLDDFGTGYSSLLHLQAMPFDGLKVDRSFVSEMTHDRECRKIVAAVVGLGQSLGLSTVAEGVENREQIELLLWMGCEMGQGWLYGKPMPIDDLSDAILAPRQKVTAALSNSLNEQVSKFDASQPSLLAQLQAVYDGVPLALAFVNCDMRYVNLNRRLADMVGLTIEEHLGRSVEETQPELFQSIGPYILRALAGENITGVEMKRRLPGTNEEISIQAHYQPARDEAGEVVGISMGFLEMVNDINDLENHRPDS